MNFTSFFLVAVCSLIGAALAGAIAFVYKRNVNIWLPAFIRRDWRPSRNNSAVASGRTRHLMFCFVDHFEPQREHPSYEIECARVSRWHEDYPQLVLGLYDADGRQPIHTYFYPEEEYRPEHLDKLVDLCRQGLGEIEIHLHHHDDTETGLRSKLTGFTNTLVSRHDALPVCKVSGKPMWSFIHGNWALDNSSPDGRNCGVNNELIILREQGCYADFTLPCAPDPAQTRMINSIYYATDDPLRPKSHDTGVAVKVGGQVDGDLMIIQGPLGFMWHSRRFGLLPRIENADVRTGQPPTEERIDAWVNTGIHVRGRPDWVFVKVHTHGAQEFDMPTLLGAPMRKAFQYLQSKYNDKINWKLHYVSAREMYNIIRAAQADEPGEPGQYRDYLIPRPAYGLKKAD